MEGLLIADAFNRHNCGITRLCSEDKTRIDEFTVHYDNAGAAVPGPASFFCSLQAELVAEHVYKPFIRVNHQGVIFSVNPESEWMPGHTASLFEAIILTQCLIALSRQAFAASTRYSAEAR